MNIFSYENILRNDHFTNYFTFTLRFKESYFESWRNEHIRFWYNTIGCYLFNQIRWISRIMVSMKLCIVVNGTVCHQRRKWWFWLSWDDRNTALNSQRDRFGPSTVNSSELYVKSKFEIIYCQVSKLRTTGLIPDIIKLNYLKYKNLHFYSLSQQTLLCFIDLDYKNCNFSI